MPLPMPIAPFVVSGFFAVCFFIVPWFVFKGDNRPIIQCCIMMSSFCMWIFYITVYIAQMNPLIGPRMDKHHIIWMASKWGRPLDEPANTRFLREGDFTPETDDAVAPPNTAFGSGYAKTTADRTSKPS